MSEVPLYKSINFGGEKRPGSSNSSSSLYSSLLSSLELSDTKVYEPYIRARLETAAHFCKLVSTNQAETALRESERARERESRTRWARTACATPPGSEQLP